MDVSTMSGGVGVWEAVAFAAAIQGVLMSLVVWTHPRGNRRANRLLATLLFLFAVQLLEIVLFWTRSLGAVPHLWGVSWFFPYLYGVLLYLYAQALAEPGVPLERRQAWHFTPFLLFVLLFAPIYLRSAETKRAALAATFVADGAANAFVLAVWSLQFLHFVVYLGASARRLVRPRENAVHHAWLRRLFMGFGVSFACWFANGLAVGAGLPYHSLIDYGTTFAMAGTIYAIGYTALRQPELFLGPVGARSAAKYAKSTLAADRAADAERRLLELMAAATPYRDPELKLEDLAARLDVHPHHLSQVINQRLGLNFNAFVNGFRVEDAKRLLADPSRREDSLLAIAFEAGFNNKTSFNQAFKKSTGTTPSRFRKGTDPAPEPGSGPRVGFSRQQS